MSNPKVSICMATFNRDPVVLRKVFESIFSQDVSFDFEVIVCDDGSVSKDAKSICEQFPIRYIRIDRPSVRRNPCVARNMTYKAALGDIIIAQSDEVMHVSQNAIKTLVTELESNPRSFIIASVLACGPNNVPWSVYTGRGYISGSIQERKVPFFFLGALWRKDLYEVGGNDEEFHNLQGYDDTWFASCLTNQLGLRPVYVDSVVAYHLYHPCGDTRGAYAISRAFYNKKVQAATRSGVWKASGGSWPYLETAKVVTETSEIERIFTETYKDKIWGEGESSSGAGSSVTATCKLRAELPNFLKRYYIRSILDLPCGDYNWMKLVELPCDYIGADIVQYIINENRKNYPDIRFEHLDLLTSDLPKVDCIFCRDCLGHLSFKDVEKALANIRKAGIKFILATTFPQHPNNAAINTGDWAPYNLQIEPFNFSEPIDLINEDCQEWYPHFNDKSIALWEL